MTDSRPKYPAVADELRRRIATGVYPPGGRLPTEQQLMADLGVSLTVIRKATGILTREGLITVTQGSGMYVPAGLDLDGPPPAPLVVGDVVHYVSRGSADGRFAALCRAATVTEIGDGPTEPLGLCVLNPTGFFFHALSDGGVLHDAGTMAPDDGAVGARCSVGARLYGPGTWHRAERVAR